MLAIGLFPCRDLVGWRVTPDPVPGLCFVLYACFLLSFSLLIHLSRVSTYQDLGQVLIRNVGELRTVELGDDKLFV